MKRFAKRLFANPSDFTIDDPWLAQVSEEILDPELPIIDPHHHLWDRQSRYLLDELLDDLGSGHDIRSTVHMQCGSMYRAGADSAYAPVGETEFVCGVAAMVASGTYGPIRVCEGIVGYADLTLGDRVVDVLAAHMNAAGGRFRGIRNSSVWDADETLVRIPIRPLKGLFDRKDFRDGFALLSELDLTFDAWLFFPQIPELAALASAFPTTRIVLDHVGTPLGIGRYANGGTDVFERWSRDIRKLAACPNVYVKLGGLGMPMTGFGFERATSPPTSLELAAAWKPYFETCIQAFGAHRCMFESNFPVDKQSCSYAVLWNAFKRLTTGYSASDRDDLFRRTAASVYRLEV